MCPCSHESWNPCLAMKGKPYMGRWESILYGATFHHPPWKATAVFLHHPVDNPILFYRFRDAFQTKLYGANHNSFWGSSTFNLCTGEQRLVKNLPSQTLQKYKQREIHLQAELSQWQLSLCIFTYSSLHVTWPFSYYFPVLNTISGINDIFVYIQVFESTASTSLMKEATHDNSMQPASTRWITMTKVLSKDKSSNSVDWGTEIHIHRFKTILSVIKYTC